MLEAKKAEEKTPFNISDQAVGGHEVSDSRGPFTKAWQS